MSTYDHACDVAVVGGGLGGASAAVAFAKQGCSVRVFERRDLSRDPNRGDILHAPTVAVLRRLGVLDLIRERGATAMRGVEVVSPDGRLAVRSDDMEHVILNHAELEAALIGAAQEDGATIEHEAARVLTQIDAGWSVATDIDATRARFLVGADGADSLTRRTLGIDLRDVHDYEHWLVVLHAARPPWLENEHGWSLYHPAGAVFILPTTPIGMIRVVAIVPRDEAAQWMTSSENELAGRLEKRHPLLGGLELTKRGGSHIYRLRRTHAAHYAGYRAALVGDAAHTTHTMGGQGLNIAIQDSAKLAELVGPLLLEPRADDSMLDGALVEYESNRRPINADALEMAHEASLMAEPGAAAYTRALDFYARAAGDPDVLRKFSERFGGRS